MPRNFHTRLARLAAVLGAAVVAASVLAGGPVPAAQAATASQWNPGMIVTDAVFYNSTAMTATQIQALLVAKGSKCISGAVPCLKDYVTVTPTIEADAYCGKYAGSSGETAAQVIAKVALACGINPQVLIATMQKETSLVTKAAPSTTDYSRAMGYACPDSSACDLTYAGFFKQVYFAARQFKVYAKSPTSYTYRAGATFVIAYSPTSACGGASVYIQNQATASLYNYTPYQPNDAALSNLYGTGNSCSSYGNRNFWLFMTDWFAATPIWVSSVAVTPKSVVVEAGKTVSLTATVLPSNASSRAVSWASSNPAIASVDASGKVTAKASGSVTVTATATDGSAKFGSAKVFVVARLSGPTRVDTAIKISQEGWPVDGSSPWVLLATGNNFPDAMAGGPLAYALDAPILLTRNPKSGLESSVVKEMDRLGVQSVIVLGSSAAIRDSIAKSLGAKYGDAKVERIGGASRYDTATLIADRLAQEVGKADTFFLTTGTNFPDALAASPIAAMNNWPILFTDPKSQHLQPSTAQWLAKGSIEPGGVVYPLGSPSVVPDVTAGDAKTATGAADSHRLAGGTRYETAIAINTYPSFTGLFTRSSTDPGSAVAITTGKNFPDAVAGGVFAARIQAPLFLVDGTATASSATTTTVRNAVLAWPHVATYVFGGTPAVTDLALRLHIT